ncbi:MAG: hypothetical protein HZA90_06155 [Verrucomicrobia bacterium]|nr:hypothetical protein [Verrucomicrobiota bacterium]
MTSETHVFKAGHSEFFARLEELPESVRLTMSLTGPPIRKAKHRKAFARWMAAIVQPLEQDGRPVVTHNANTGELAVIV